MDIVIKVLSLITDLLKVFENPVNGPFDQKKIYLDKPTQEKINELKQVHLDLTKGYDVIKEKYTAKQIEKFSDDIKKLAEKTLNLKA